MQIVNQLAYILNVESTGKFAKIVFAILVNGIITSGFINHYFVK